MAKQGNWNKSFWKKLDNLNNTQIDKIRQVMLEECGKVEYIMQENTPIQYGGLKSSIYAVVVDTENGVSARVGYTQTPHWDLDPANPHQDDITNPNLAQHLLETVNNEGTYIKLDIIQLALDDFQENVRNRVNETLKRR